jgi:hypothetical protein
MKNLAALCGFKWRVFLMDKKVGFRQGEEKREQLELPTLHFVTMDQWIDVIGEKALFAWLKMYTWCDRDNSKGDKPVDINLWEQSKIPDSFTKIKKKLGVGNDTFYNKILKPLWNVGLIDIEEWEEDPRYGQKAMNIIVYKYPQNNKSLSFAKLTEIRNYDKDYSSTAKNFAKKGGRPKKKDQHGNDSQPDPLSNNESRKGGSQLEHGGVLSQNGGGSQLEQGMVLSQNGGGSQLEQGGFSLRTRGGSEIGDNNILNSFNNNLNNLNNNLNNLNNNLNSSSSLNIEKYNAEVLNLMTKEEEEEEMNEINSYTIDFLKNELKYSDYIVSDIVKHMKLNGLNTLTKKQMLNQARRISLWVSENKKEIREFGYFFINGILKHEPSMSIIDRENELKKLQEKRKEAREIENFIQMYFELNGKYPTQEEIDNRDYSQYVRKIPFYNWLES